MMRIAGLGIITITSSLVCCSSLAHVTMANHYIVGITCSIAAVVAFQWFSEYLSNSHNTVTPSPDIAFSAGDKNWKEANSIYDFTAKDIDGKEVSLERYRGHVVLIVNLASKCGLTDKTYTQLQKLHEKYAESKGLRILGFPCNQFASQEPGTESEIKEFVKNKYNIHFDMFSKIDVNGDNAHPLWKYLKHKQGGTFGDFIKWNFTKFIVDKEGQPVNRFGPEVDPIPKIEEELLKYF